MRPLPARLIAARAAAIAGSIGSILAALWWSGIVTPIWHVTLLGVAAFYVLVHVIPEAIFRWQSMPYTYQLHNNWGARGFELQNVTYAAYHTRWYNHATHAAFPIEAWLWFVAAAHVGGPLASAALGAGLCAQALSFREPRFGAALCALWAAFAASAVLAVSAWGGGAYEAAQLGLVGLGFWRFSGHWVEPLPPGVVGQREFVELSAARPGWQLLRPMALGYLSEFSAGLPFRLVNSWLYALALRLGYRAQNGANLVDLRKVARQIHAHGWSAHETTAAIVTAAHALPIDALEPRRTLASSAPLRAVASTPASPEAEAAGEFAIRVMACDRGAAAWLVRAAGRTILFDAWLTDSYFASSERFFVAHRKEAARIVPRDLPPLDALVLTSAQQDHAHPDALAQLDRSTPVYACPAAARLASKLGFTHVTALAAGERAQLAGGALTLLALAGYGLNTPYVLRERASGERLCIAHHSVHPRWLRRHGAAAFAGEFAPREDGRLVDTLCVGVHTTYLELFGLPRWLLGDAGTNVPDPRDSAPVVAQLAPRRVLFSHCTREVNDGFAIRHLLRFPTGEGDAAHAEREFHARSPHLRILGIPEPAVWL